MGWKKLIFGEKMPDKDDPKYKDRYEKEVETGKKFARITRIDKVAASLQRFANEHRNLFLAIVFGIVICCFTFNIYRIALVCNASSKQEQTTATQRQENNLSKILLKAFEGISPVIAREWVYYAARGNEIDISQMDKKKK